VIVHRILAIAAAVFFVAAVGIATFGAETMSLGQALDLIAPDVLNKLPAWFGDWAWVALARPLMVRPAWMVPLSLGMILGGLSASLSNRKTTHRSHRRS
jgi:hypothetical protein